MNGQEGKQSQKSAGPTDAAAKKGGRWRPVLLLAVLVAILILAKVLPGTALYVVGADAFTQGRVPWGLIGALAVVIVILTFLVRSARKKLQLKEMQAQAGSVNPGELYREPKIIPRDQHNEALLANVHPPAWENPEPAPRYNLVVIGAGTAGLVTAAGPTPRPASSSRMPCSSGARN